MTQIKKPFPLLTAVIIAGVGTILLFTIGHQVRSWTLAPDTEHEHAILVTALSRDSLWTAWQYPDGDTDIVSKVNQLPQTSNDPPFVGNLDIAFRWALQHDCRYFVQYRNSHVVCYYRYVVKGVSFGMVTVKKDTMLYWPQVDGWARVVGNPGAHPDEKGNICFADVSYGCSPASDSVMLSDSAILKRLYPNPIKDTCICQQ